MGSIAFDLQAVIDAAGAPRATRLIYATKTLRHFTENMAASLDGAARRDLSLVPEELIHAMDTVHIDHRFQHAG